MHVHKNLETKSSCNPYPVYLYINYSGIMDNRNYLVLLHKGMMTTLAIPSYAYTPLLLNQARASLQLAHV